MRNSKGITQTYWETLNEDQRFGWKIFTKLLALCLGILILKTGYIIIDSIIAVITMLFASLVIESQRSYDKFTPRNRKKIIRIAISIGSWSIAFLGISLFAQIGAIGIQTIVSIMINMQFNMIPSKLLQTVILILFIIGATVKVIKSFREYDIEELAYHAPRIFLKNLFVKKQFRINNFPLFGYFELTILFATAIYSSAAAQTIKVFITILHTDI